MNENDKEQAIAIAAGEAPPRAQRSVYPEPFFSRMEGRVKRPLGDLFGLANFGVNQTTLAPAAESALLHRHSKQDEFIYILEGTPTLVTDAGERALRPGMCAGFPASGPAHHLVNRSAEPVVYLEIGDRSAGDEPSYPDDDLAPIRQPDGTRTFAHKDGTPY